jgi:hypothetical protein
MCPGNHGCGTSFEPPAEPPVRFVKAGLDGQGTCSVKNKRGAAPNESQVFVPLFGMPENCCWIND